MTADEEGLMEQGVEGVDQEVDEDEMDREFAFAMAPIVRLMKDELDNDKMIRSRVKAEMNQWLEKMCRKVSKRMNESDYTMVEMADFQTAIEPYEMVEDIEQERHRIVASLEKVKADCDSLIRDVNRKFISDDEDVVRYGTAEEELDAKLGLLDEDEEEQEEQQEQPEEEEEEEDLEI